jgi:predicted house-cleaning noncanonical NTP pyrophosphatase (MazG superfamily)
MAEKLVRDFIPFIIMAKGEPTPKMRVAKDRTEAFDLLVAKLNEEVAELREALSTHRDDLVKSGNLAVSYQDAIDACAEEAADVLQVLYGLFTAKELENLRQQKKADRGGFDNLVVIDFPEKKE